MVISDDVHYKSTLARSQHFSIEPFLRSAASTQRIWRSHQVPAHKIFVILFNAKYTIHISKRFTAVHLANFWLFWIVVDVAVVIVFVVVVVVPVSPLCFTSFSNPHFLWYLFLCLFITLNTSKRMILLLLLLLFQSFHAHLLCCAFEYVFFMNRENICKILYGFDLFIKWF